MVDKTFTLNNGVQFTVDDAARENYLFNDRVPKAIPDEAETMERVQRVFADNYVDFTGLTSAGVDLIGNAAPLDIPSYRNPNSYFYERELQERNEAYKQDNIFLDTESDDDAKYLKASSKLALYKHLGDFSPETAEAKAKAIELKLNDIEESIGRPLTQDEITLYVAQNEEKQINEMLDESASDIPLKLLANPQVQSLMGPDVTKMAIAKWQADHPAPRGFFGDFARAWSKTQEQGNLKEEEANNALAIKVADELDAKGFGDVANFVRSKLVKESRLFNDIQTQMNMAEIAHGPEGGAMYKAGEVAQGIVAPYQTGTGLAALAAGGLLLKGRGFGMVNSALNGYDYYQNNAFDIAYQSALRRESLQDNFADTLIQASPEAAAGALTEAVESALLTRAMGAATSKIYNKLKSNAGKSPTLAAADGKLADEIKGNVENLKNSAFKDFLKGFAVAYPQALATQGLTTATQGAITQHGINRLVGDEVQALDDAAVNAVKDNLGTIAVLSLIPGGLNGLSRAIANKNTADALNDHNQRLESEAVAAASPIHKLGPQAAEMVFTLTDNTKYRFSAADLVNAYKARGLTPDTFRAQLEKFEGDFKDLEAKAEAGDDIVMTKAHWEAYYAKDAAKGQSDVYDFFSPYLRTERTEISLEELKERLSPESLERMSKELIDHINSENMTNALASHIRNDIATKMHTLSVRTGVNVDYLSALTANFFKKLSDATGVDGVELYNRYGPAFEKKDESLNLTGETRESDAIGKGGGAYSRYAGKYILDKDTSITTVVHEFGHFYLDSLERVAKDTEFAVDKTKVEQEIAAIKQALGYKADDAVDEQMHEKFAAALVASIAGDGRSYYRGKSDELVHGPDGAKFNASFSALKSMIHRGLSSVYADKKKELEEAGVADIHNELALQEYRERFDASFNMSEELRDFMTSHVLGRLAYDQHVQLAGLHPVLDKAVLKELDPELAAEVDKVSNAITQESDELQAMYNRLEHTMIIALRRGSAEFDKLKKEIIDSYYNEKNQLSNIDDAVASELDKRRKEFLKTYKADTSKNEQIDAAAKQVANEAYDTSLNKAKDSALKELKKQSAQAQKELLNHFKAYDIFNKHTLRAQSALRSGGDVKAIERDLMDELESIYGKGSEALDTIARQSPLFKVVLNDNGTQSLNPSKFPFADSLNDFAAKDANGNISTVKHRATAEAPSYFAIKPDRALISEYFDKQLNDAAQTLEPDTKAMQDAKASYDAAYSKALNNKDLVTPDGATVGLHTQAMRDAAANTYLESIKESVTKEIEAKAENKKRSAGAYPDELKPVLEMLDKLKALNEETTNSKRLRKEATRKLEMNPAWHILQYMKLLDNADKINYEDARRLLGLRDADRLLKNGTAAHEGTVTLDKLGKDGPIRGALGDTDKILQREFDRAWKQMNEAKGMASLGIKSPEAASDLSRGLAIARALASFGNRTADQVINEQVQRNILTKSKDVAIDSLKYNPALIGITKKAFLKVNKLERGIIDKLAKKVGLKARTETEIKLLSDTLINRHTVSDFHADKLVKASGTARDRANRLASRLAEGPEVIQQISNMLTLDAVNKMAANNGEMRLNEINKNKDALSDFLKKGAKDTKNYDQNHLLVMKVAAARIGLISDSKGNEAQKLLRHAPDEVKALLEQIENDQRFSGDWKLKTIPDAESALETLMAMKDYARAVQKQRMQDDKDAFVMQSGAIVEQLDKVSKPSAPYAEKDGVRSWAANPFKNLGRVVTRAVNSYLVKMEQFCIKIDRGDNGPLTRYLYQPIRNAYDEAQKAKLVAQKEANAIIQRAAALENKGIIETDMVDANGKRIAFGMDGKYKGNGTLELVSFLTHIGNDSNRMKLLKGVGISEEAFVKWFAKAQDDGTITKEMLDTVQAYWDFNAKYWPALQEAYYKASGRYVTEVKPREFVTKFGTYKGGYAPALRDADLTTGPLDRNGDLDTLITGNALGEFFGEASFTKERSDTFAQQLKVDIGSQLSNTISVVHYAHMLDPATKVYRMINDPTNNLKAALDSRSPDFVQNNIVKWLSRALRDSSSNNPTSGPFFNFLRTMTNRIGLSYMFGNLSNATQGLTNLIVAAAHIKPGYIVNSIARYCYDFGNMRNEMLDASDHMRLRFEANIDKTIDEVMKLELAKNDARNAALSAAKTGLEQSRQFMQHHGYFLQTWVQHGIDTIIWHAAHNEAMARKMSDAEALAYADSSIRLTQGSMDVIDLTNIEAGHPVLKMFTQFTSYFNTLLNLIMVNMRRNLGDDVGRIERASRAAYVLTTVVIVPAILSDWIAEAFKGNNVFTESEEWDDFLFKHAVTPTFKMSTAMIPLFGSGVNLATAQLTGSQAFGGLIGTPATIGAIDSSLKLLKSVVNGNEPNSPWKDGLTVLGMLSGVPAGTAIGKRIDFATKNDVDSLTDALRLICSGDLSNDEKERN